MFKPLMDAVENWGHLDVVLDGIDAVAKRTGKDATEILEYLEKCKLVSNGRSVHRAGQWSPSKKQVELHAKLLMKDRETERTSTFLHEVAHAIVSCAYKSTWDNKISAHGDEWKFVMRCLKRNPSRTHNYDFLHTEQNAKLIYACMCGCGTELLAQRKKKSVETRYFTRCGGRMYLKRNNVTRQSFPNPADNGAPATINALRAAKRKAAIEDSVGGLTLRPAPRQDRIRIGEW